MKIVPGFSHVCGVSLQLLPTLTKDAHEPLKHCLTKACSPHQNHTKSRFVCASKHTVNTLRSSTKAEISQKDNVKETSPCFNSDASRHNYYPQSAVVMTWVNRVNKSCCVATKTNDIFSLLPLMVIFLFVYQLGLQE